MTKVTDDEELLLYFQRLSASPDRAMGDVDPATAVEGQRLTSELYDTGKQLVQRASESPAEWLDYTRI